MRLFFHLKNVVVANGWSVVEASEFIWENPHREDLSADRFNSPVRDCWKSQKETSSLRQELKCERWLLGSVVLTCFSNHRPHWTRELTVRTVRTVHFVHHRHVHFPVAQPAQKGPNILTLKRAPPVSGLVHHLSQRKQQDMLKIWGVMAPLPLHPGYSYTTSIIALVLATELAVTFHRSEIAPYPVTCVHAFVRTSSVWSALLPLVFS